MRYIDTSSIIVPANWVLLAKAELGNTYASLWSYFRLGMENLVGKKCWYSESCNIGSLNPIDHFRPKANRVKSLTSAFASLDASLWAQMDTRSRAGYPFLEFEFSNYRYACYVVNSSNKKETTDGTTKGKLNFFPLQNGSPFGTSIPTLNTEISCLLDPCNLNDPALLTFNEFGKINPHVALLNVSWEYCRVLVSIELYHLHYYYFVEKRRELWDYCKERIELADTIYIKAVKTPEEERILLSFIRELNNKINKKSEFSAVAIDCISFYKASYPWLNILFPAARMSK